MIAEHVPHARELVLRHDGYEEMEPHMLLDASGVEIEESDETVAAMQQVRELDFLVDFSAKDFGAARVDLAQWHESEARIDFDRVRRLRGVADDPNQPSLFGKGEDLAAYGWAG